MSRPAKNPQKYADLHRGDWRSAENRRSPPISKLGDWENPQKTADLRVWRSGGDREIGGGTADLGSGALRALPGSTPDPRSVQPPFRRPHETG